MSSIIIGPYTFLTAAVVEGGFLFQTPEVVEEKLTTPGVDGSRWRTVSNQMLPASIDAVSEALSFLNAVSAASAFRFMKGELVPVVWTTGGYTYRYKDVHVSDVQCKPTAGAVVGGGASSSAVAHVRTLWILEATDFTKFTTG